LTAKTSEITVSYQGKTAKFNVNVTAAGATLSHITAEYNQSEIVYPSTPLDDLKDYLIVTAHLSDSTSYNPNGFTPVTQVVKGGTLTMLTAPTKNNCNFNCAYYCFICIYLQYNYY